MKVLIAYDMGAEFITDLRQSFPQVDFAPAYTMSEQLRHAPQAEVHFGEIAAEVYRVSTRLRWFHFVGIGFDGVLRDIPEMVDNDVLMTNARGTHVIPMADHVFAAVLAFAHRLPDLMADRQARRWEQAKYIRTMRELAGTTMGVLAMGDIGRAVARRAAAFDMEVYAVDILPMEAPEGVRAVWGAERLDDLLALSDWLVVTAPLTAATRGLIGRAQLQILKAGAHVIVVSRGGIVDEDALAAALQSGHVAGAALDATATEPLPADSALWDMDNVLLSPHVSAESPQLIERRKAIFKENLGRYLAGEELLNICDKQAGY